MVTADARQPPSSASFFVIISFLSCKQHYNCYLYSWAQTFLRVLFSILIVVWMCRKTRDGRNFHLRYSCKVRDSGLSLNTKSQISFLITLALRQVPAIKGCDHDESAWEHAFKNFQIFILPWLSEDFWHHFETHKTIKQIWVKPTAAYIWWQS